MKKTALIAFTSLLICFVSPYALKAKTMAKNTSYLAEAKVVDIQDTGQINTQNHRKILKVKLLILSGSLKNTRATIEDNQLALAYRINYKKGDSVIITVSDDGLGHKSIYISDYDRRPVLYVLFFLFLLAIVLVTKRQGITSLAGMVFSLYIIAQMIIPNILQGSDPIIVTIIASMFIVPVTYYLAHGVNKKTTVAVIGTFITLIVVAFFSYFFSRFANLTGYANEDAVFLQNIYGSSLNVFSLLISGILIGGVAVLNDITISQASVVASLKEANRDISTAELYKHAMDVGKDHVASLVNTLVLVYVGAALPLILLFTNSRVDFSLILNQEIIATEIVRTLVTSIGIVFAVPITTYLACFYFRK